MKWIDILETELNKELAKAPSIVLSHDINHVRRVLKNAESISRGMKVDWEILAASIYLHDIGRHYPEGVREHGPVSAPFAKNVLERIQFPKEKNDHVIKAITYHDETFPSSKRDSIEAKILYDADKLDVFGAIGVARYLIFNSLRGKQLEETVDYALKNLPLRYEGLELDKTKKIAKKRYNYAIDYFKRLKQDLVSESSSC